MTTKSGLLEWYKDEDGYQAANVRLSDRPGIVRKVPFGKLTRIEVIFPLVASASNETDSYFLESTQSWIDDIGAEPMPPEK